MKLVAIVEIEPEGGYSAEIPALPGCVTQGDTLEELKANLIKVGEGWLETAQVLAT
jgi:predicted RNase H-like HicB family nuclease